MNKKKKFHRKRKSSKKHSAMKTQSRTTDVENKDMAAALEECSGPHYNDPFFGEDIVPPGCVTFHVDIVENISYATQAAEVSRSIKHYLATASSEHASSSTISTPTSESTSSSKPKSSPKQFVNPSLSLTSTTASQIPTDPFLRAASNPSTSSQSAAWTSVRVSPPRSPSSGSSSSASSGSYGSALSEAFNRDSIPPLSSINTDAPSTSTGSTEEDENFVAAPSALRIAALRNDAMLVHSLLVTGSDPNERCREDGRSVVHCAAANGCCKAMKVLLKAGADPNIRDDDGRTPLHYASSNGHTDVVSALIMAGAIVDARSNSMQGNSTSTTDSSFGTVNLSFFDDQQKMQFEQMRRQWKEKLKVLQSLRLGK